jgi:hypothetical protein
MNIIALAKSLLADLNLKADPAESAIVWRAAVVSMTIGNLDRLRKLQGDLFSVGQDGDETIATYIELCGDFDSAARVLDQMIEYAQKRKFSNDSMRLLDISVTRAKELMIQMDKLETQGKEVLGRLRGQMALT